jgi:hypothetical protein
MATTEPEYQRLPGRGIRRGGFLQVMATSSRLWLGRDHLLLVDSSGFTETYKRFYFRDIAAITLARTNRRAVWNGIAFIFTLLFGAAALALGGMTAAIFGSMAGLCVLLSLINVALGPTCVCHLTTAVQTDELASFRRFSQALKVLARLRPLLVAAQEQPGPASDKRRPHLVEPAPVAAGPEAAA